MTVETMEQRRLPYMIELYIPFSLAWATTVSYYSLHILEKRTLLEGSMCTLCNRYEGYEVWRFTIMRLA